MPRPQLFLMRRDGTTVAELANARLESVEWTLNDPGSLDFSMQQNDPRVGLVSLAEHEVQLRIDDVISWQGPVWKCKGNARSVTFSANGLLSYFERRFITNSTQTFTSVDQFNIAFGLITYAQSQTDQDLKITNAGSAASGVTRSRVYKREDHQQILELLQEFPDLVRSDNGVRDGFDFDVVPGTRVFTPYYPRKGTVRSALVLEFGRNVTDYEVEEDAIDLTNRAYATGGSNGDVKFEQNYKDTVSAAKYGEMQSIFAVGDEKDVVVLAQRARDYVEKRKNPVVNPGVSAVEVPVALLGTVSVGDTMPIRIVNGRHNITGNYRIGSIKWQVRPNTLNLSFIEAV